MGGGVNTLGGEATRWCSAGHRGRHTAAQTEYTVWATHWISVWLEWNVAGLILCVCLHNCQPPVQSSTPQTSAAS